ncbi:MULTISPECIES: transglycosylase domain-containing protein [Halocynthiibacter]|uniref:peptidoglycan glycosyltransferase n=1 Tax=Halocynthiibacter halioticoli TaxID=2986804 RepID=A0AAE3J192_9RHOB|nr:MULTISPECIES: PBP1A family penicillin-binding protein [Halocynthiibacter]MCV6825895.1 PBP1A family penicillin-binding protein [Halocynthiibacter halioticoli]MCW4058896.1 PBP1A family penicillin-binding protein [Halocynthiibacter sp. SDUM655004]
MSSSGRKRPNLVAEKRYTKKKAPAKKAAGKKTARKTSKPQKRRSPRKTVKRNPISRLFRWMVRAFWGITWRVSVVFGIMLAIGILYFVSTMPDMEQMVDGRTRGSVTILDRDEKVFAWRGDQFGGMITAQTVSPHLKNAVVATEDKRFYRHFGLSPRGIVGAMRINLSEGRSALSGHGGSTITQQTAKLLCLGVPHDPKQMTEREYEADCRQGSIWRKAKEAVYAMALETKFTKDEILTIYLNRAFLGAGARGFEAASQRYFGISANQVSPAQAAMLAGLLVAPSRYAPTNNLKRSQERSLTVIKLMEKQGYLTSAEAAHARANPAVLSKAANAHAGGYFADWVMSTAPSFLTRETTEDVIIQSTLDQRIQRAAEEAIDYIFTNKVREGSKAQTAVVVMSSDGAVRAMVGGRETRVTGAFNRATQAYRQTGSAFKPFVYATALDLGYNYNDYVRDEPLTINIPGSGPWSPDNYDHKYRGMVTLTEALKNSLNIPAVKVSEAVGRENVRTVAGMFGIQSDLAAGPALALGASESTLLEMTGAYAGILNGGQSVTPYGMIELRLQGDDTPMFGQEGGMGERVISRNAAEQLTYMMHQVVESGTGHRAKLSGYQAAGKTGTSQSARDAWFIGFTADYVTGVWMGYDDNTPLTGVTGSGLPAEIWHETMVRVMDGLPATPLPMINGQPAAPYVGNDSPSRNNQRQKSSNPIENLLIQLFGGGG